MTRRLKMKNENKLVAHLFNKTYDLNQSPHELARILGVGYAYLMALARGDRPTEGLRREALVRAARYLSIPVAQAYLLAGVLEPSDFLVDESPLRRAECVIEAMRQDPAWCGFVPPASVLREMDENLVLLISQMYLKLVGEGDAKITVE